MELDHRRNRNIITGLIALVSLFGADHHRRVVALRRVRRQLPAEGQFDAAGQGSQNEQRRQDPRASTSARSRGVELVDGRCPRHDGHQRQQQIPSRRPAIVRPKTLFGEKFVDIVPGAGEATGPLLDDECSTSATSIRGHCLGGFELEQVLGRRVSAARGRSTRPSWHRADSWPTRARPRADDQPADRQLREGSRRQRRTRRRHPQFLTDLALLSDELGHGPTTWSRGGRRPQRRPADAQRAGATSWTTVLDQTARLSSDVADVLDATTGLHAQELRRRAAEALNVL